MSWGKDIKVINIRWIRFKKKFEGILNFILPKKEKVKGKSCNRANKVI
ncbi:hypothetical protein SAMN05660865_01023 [Caloramator fervidus]|uniref:Uncharacterized protein n=1 Tax=Caloramator fervidus TaxID=29344 RepID=A0A1H5UVM9_9CLOT|nr:hypothetical protein [Caloramator fervidus]SEF79066.1 hypothetical protein SAMN05660865_01023 [Caloramator fervidus]